MSKNINSVVKVHSLEEELAAIEREQKQGFDASNDAESVTNLPAKDTLVELTALISNGNDNKNRISPGIEVNLHTNSSQQDGLLPHKMLSHDEMFNKILKAHEKNDLEQSQCDTAKQYMDRIAYQVPLDQLYQIIACCQFEEGAPFCPVLIKIMDQKIIQESGGKPFLMQVWTQQGEMIFERPLSKPPANWNIQLDKLIFLEETNAKEIYMVKLFTDKKPILFSLKLPDDLTHGLINSSYDHDVQNFVIDRENTQNNLENGNKSMLDVTLRSDTYLNSNGIARKRFTQNQNDSKQDDIDEMRMIGEIRDKDYKENQEISQQSVSDCFKQKELIIRAPDKMISFFYNNIILAFRDNIFQINIAETRVDERQSSDDVIVTEIANDQIRLLDLSENFKIISIQPLADQTTIVLEEKTNFQMRFMRLKLSENQNKLWFIQLGVLVNRSEMTTSPLLKYRAVSKVSDQTGKQYQIGVVLRENGRFEVYSDYILVNEYYNNQLQCVDIATDFNQFYFKFVEDSHLVTEEDADEKKLKILVRKVPHFWRNRVGFNTSKKTNPATWDVVIHKRISAYFRLYTQIQIFSMYLLVSHRNMISVYQMTKSDKGGSMNGSQRTGQNEEDEESQQSGQWIQTIAFEQGYIRKILIKKRPKQERIDQQRAQNENFQNEQSARSQQQSFSGRNILDNFQKYIVMAIIGTHSIQYIQFDHKGRLVANDKGITAPGRIVRFQDDTQWRNGTLILTDEVKDSDDYQKCSDSLLYTFPLNTENVNLKLSLHALKYGQFHELISSGTEIGKCCDYDSQFGVIRANKSIFQQEDDENDEVTKHVDKARDFVNVLVCRSDKNDTTSLFPLLKDRESATSKIIKGMRLIQKDSNRKVIEHKDRDKTQLLESFFVTQESFGENQNNYCTVTEKEIKIYDEDMQLRLKFEGLNIRSCQQVHETQLYTISDDIFKPPIVTKYFGEDEGEPMPLDNFTFQNSGFYVFDIPQLFRGTVEFYKLADSIGGQSSLVSKSKFGNRFTFLKSFLDIVVIPLPHLNLIECIGMGSKSDYLVWREKNGFFTALDRYGSLRTWSLVSGKMIYLEKQQLDGATKNTKDYEVYTADENDITYTQNFYNFKESSLSLLKSKTIISKPLLQEQDIEYNEPLLERMLKKGQVRNKDGTVKASKAILQLGKGLFKARDSSIDVRVKNSEQKSDLYHFKVMELKVHEDTQDLSQCKVRFHFYFELLRQKTRDNLSQFEWDVNSNPKQYLYLSKDTRRLMEVINNYTATVYYRGNINENGNFIDDKNQDGEDQDLHDPKDFGQQVKWKEDYRITRFPRLTEQTSVPVLFSPNFNYQFDVNFRNESFVILESKNRHVYMNIPRDLLTTQWNFLEEKQAVKLICSRFKWVTEKIFRIINQSNVDCLFEMKSTDYSDQDPKQRYLKLLSAVKVDNLHENQNQLDSEHLLVQRKQLKDDNVIERLIRANQEYKTSLQHAINVKATEFKPMSRINKINYSRPWFGQDSQFDIELTFTWIDWRITDLIISPEVDIDLHDIDKDQRIQMCFDIFPKGRSVLHQIALWAQATDTYTGARELFKVTSEKKEYEITGAEGEISFEVPILPDIYGQTPLDICLLQSKEADPEKFIEEAPESEMADRSENFAMAEEIFKGIKDYGYNHSSQFITNAIIYAIDEGLHSVIDYLEARLKDAEDTFRDNRTQRDTYKNKRLTCPALEEYSLATSKLWENDSKIQEELFDPKARFVGFNMHFLDLPLLFKPCSSAYEFIYALAESDIDLKIFELASVQIIIDYQTAFWRRYNYFGFGLPMTLQLFFFVWWSNIVITNLGKEDTFDTQNDVLQTCLTLTAIYLLILEIYAIYRAKLEYLRNATRLLNLITPTLIMINVYNVEATGETYFWTIQCWAGICIWLRFFLFLGTLDTFSWMVRLIIKSFSDMKSFLIIFTIGVLAFSDADLSLRKILELRGVTEPREIPEDADVYDKYFFDYFRSIKISFLTGALASPDENLMEYRDVDWIVFILCVLFNIIVLLNTLIAIVGQTFSEMLDAKVAEGYKEKATQIGYMQDSLFGFFMKQQNQDPNELLVIVKILDETSAEQEEDGGEEGLAERVESLHEKFEGMQEDLKFIREKLLEDKKD